MLFLEKLEAKAKSQFHAILEAERTSKRSYEESSKLLKKFNSAVTIVDQMEYYFSDANLQSDAHMLMLIGSSPDGFVCLKHLSKFKKISKLSKDRNYIARCIRILSAHLCLNKSGDKIKRKAVYRKAKLFVDLRKRSILASRLGKLSTNELKQKFLSCGEVVHFEYCQSGGKVDELIMLFVNNLHSIAPKAKTQSRDDDSVELLRASLTNPALLVIFLDFSGAECAITTLNDANNWRRSMHVRGLVKVLKRKESSSSNGVCGNGNFGKNDIGLLVPRAALPQNGSPVDQVLQMTKYPSQPLSKSSTVDGTKRPNRLFGKGSLAALLGETKPETLKNPKIGGKRGYLLDIVGLGKANVAVEKIRVAKAPDGTRGFSCAYVESRGAVKILNASAKEFKPFFSDE